MPAVVVAMAFDQLLPPDPEAVAVAMPFVQVLELAGFALMDSLWLTAVTVTMLNLAALRRRILIEQGALAQAPPSSPAAGVADA